jgi:glycosyltransferase involved in cell wall biosynthesis
VKIMQVHNLYRSAAPSGENRVVDTEAQALTAAGHEVVRFERRSDDIAQWSRVRKAALPVTVLRGRMAAGDIATTIREHRPDVVHVHNTFPLIGPAVLYACRDAGVPAVFTIHNKRLVCASGDFFRNGEVCHDCLHGSRAQAITHGCYRGSRLATIPQVMATGAHREAWQSLVSAYIFISASLRDLLSGLDLDEERVFVRHHLIPRKSVPPALVRQPQVIFVGRLEEAKGIRVLMAAWDRYRVMSPCSELSLVIVGTGQLEQEVVAWASTRPSVKLTGRIDDSALLELLCASRAALVPSTCEETFGLVVVESMAVGLPPVAAAHGALPELITPGVDGELFRPGDPQALAEAIVDVEMRPEVYRAYSARARKTYEERFDPDQTLEKLLEVYRFAIGNPV